MFLGPHSSLSFILTSFKVSFVELGIGGKGVCDIFIFHGCVHEEG